MLQDCVGIRADAYKPPVNKFTLKIEKKKRSSAIRAELFCLNFLKETAGGKPELSVVRRAPDCQGARWTWSQGVIWGTSTKLRQCHIPVRGAGEKGHRPRWGGGHRHESAPQKPRQV